MRIWVLALALCSCGNKSKLDVDRSSAEVDLPEPLQTEEKKHQGDNRQHRACNHERVQGWNG